MRRLALTAPFLLATIVSAAAQNERVGTLSTRNLDVPNGVPSLDINGRIGTARIPFGKTTGFVADGGDLAFEIQRALTAEAGKVAPDTNGSISAQTAAASGGSAYRSLSAWFADTFNIKSYGAIGDGASHPVSTVYPDVTSRATLCVRYAFECNGFPYGQLVQAFLPVSAASGANSLTMAVTRQVGLTFNPTPLAAGATTIPYASMRLPSTGVGRFVLTPGTMITGPGLPTGGTPVLTVSAGSFTIGAGTLTGATTSTTVWTALQASPGVGAMPQPSQSGPTILTYYGPGMDALKASGALTGGGLANGSTAATVACNQTTNQCQLNGVSPAPSAGSIDTTAPIVASVSWKIYLTDTSGVYPQMAVSGDANLPAGETLSDVNQAEHSITLDLPAGIVPGGANLTFSWPQLQRLNDGNSWQLWAGGVGNGAAGIGATLDGSGNVQLASATTAEMDAVTAVDATTPQFEGWLLTFWRKDTDAEARNRQIDSLAANLAAQAAKARSLGAGIRQPCGGTVEMPAAHYVFDQPLVLPSYWQFATQAYCQVNLRSSGKNTTIISPLADFGMLLPVISSDDPTAHWSNNRGLYQNSGIQFSDGDLKGFSILPMANVTVTGRYGVRPQWSGAPVNMIGILQGGHRFPTDVAVKGMYIGDELIPGDHTRWNRVQLINNYMGFRLAPISQAGGVHTAGDLHFAGLEASANYGRNISIAPNSYLSGSLSDETHLAYSPYDIYLEPGGGSPTGIGSLSMAGQVNLEGDGCSVIADGGQTSNYYGSNGSRGITSLVMDHVFALHDHQYQPVGGCIPSYVNVFEIGQMEIRTIAGLSFGAGNLPGQNNGPIVQVARIAESGGFAGVGSGSVDLNGDGLSLLWQQYANLGTSMVRGTGGPNDAFFQSGAFRRVRFDIPGQGLVARLWPMIGSGALSIGTIAEYVASGGQVQVQRAGTSSTAALVAGEVLQSWAALPTAAGNNVYLPVQTAGSEKPVLTGAAAALGATLYAPAVSSPTPGVAATTGTTPLGVAVTSDSASLAHV